MPGPRCRGMPSKAKSQERIAPGPGWATLRLPERSQSEGDGLAADLTHPLSLSDANTARVANRPGRPTPVQPVGRKEDTRKRIAPIIGKYARLKRKSDFQRGRPASPGNLP